MDQCEPESVAMLMMKFWSEEFIYKVQDGSVPTSVSKVQQVYFTIATLL